MISRTEKEDISFLLKNDENKSEDIESLSSSSCEALEDSNEDFDYFGDDKCFLSSSTEEEVWCDSESEEDCLREKYKKEAEWLNDKKFKKTTITKKTHINISYIPGIFKSNYNIKLIRHSKDLICLVDTMNIIYLLQNNKLLYSLKLDKWRVSDVTFFDDKLLICNNKYNRIKQIVDGTIIDINKIYTRNINKFVVIKDRLYILGDTTVTVNKYLEIEDESYNKLINIVLYKNNIIGLSSNGDILHYTEDLKLLNKIIFPDKFRFTNLFSTTDYIVILTNTGFIIINEDYKFVKESTGDINNITEYKGMYLFFIKSGLRLLNKDFDFVKVKSKIKTCKDFINIGEEILMFSNREMHKLTLHIK